MADIVVLGLLFLLSFTLHNLEEALWMPKWKQDKIRFLKPAPKNEFYFALIVLTSLSYLAVCLLAFYPEQRFFTYIFAGFLGAMTFNAIFPHLAATIALRKYAPGVITAVLLMLPINGLILFYMASNGVLSVYEIVLSTLGVGIPMAASLPLLFWIGRKLIRFD
ncbi:HXXEE domain-containing protein [Methanocella sp. MCL-LM]|uniref:HXXEE domain-containing protein n=1 Tax=Methanocella sp. MCL-LM TaxID=3412035 RepID=UPI003C7118B5